MFLGVTGGRSELPTTLPDFVQRVKNHVDKPLAVGKLSAFPASIYTTQVLEFRLESILFKLAILELKRLL